MKFVVITGMSGAGKSQAIKAFEDMDYYCMDNLPPMLLPEFARLCQESINPVDKVAIVLDIRGGQFFKDLVKSLEFFNENGHFYKILFLDASDEVLIKRFKENRRPHPLNPNLRIIDAIDEERKILEKIKEKSEYIIDTSSFTNAQLKEEIINIFLEGKKSKNISVSIISFGFKKGLPLDCDLVFDVRFLPNPHYIDELKNLTGNNREVRNYVMKHVQSKIFLKKLDEMLEFLLPYYEKEGKTQLVIGIGCTGGHHRSVTIANLLEERIKKMNYRPFLTYRDKDK